LHVPVRHVVIIVKENKQVDEEFSDIPGVMGDTRLLVYGRRFTPNAHRLAEQYTIADWLDAEGEGSEYGHAWLTNPIANDYLQRNSPISDGAGKSPRVAWSIWRASRSMIRRSPMRPSTSTATRICAIWASRCVRIPPESSDRTGRSLMPQRERG
jgi:hypothetical protein